MLCKKDNSNPVCGSVVVYDTTQDKDICYVNSASISKITALYEACTGDLWLREGNNDTPFAVGCIDEGHGATIENLVGEMFGKKCKTISGFSGTASGQYGERYCYFCTAQNTIATDQNTCTCKDGYTDADSNMSNGCEATK